MSVAFNETTTTPTGDRLKIIGFPAGLNLYNGSLPYTVSFWVKPIGLPAGLFVLFSISKDFDDYEYIGFDNSARFVMQSSRNLTAAVNVVSPQFLSFSQWHYVVIQRQNATTALMRVDGAAYNLPAFNASTRAIQTNVEFGTQLTSGEFPAIMEIAHARLWFDTLTADELAAEMVSTTPVRQTNLWSSWAIPSSGVLFESGDGAASLPLIPQGTLNTGTSPTLVPTLIVPRLDATNTPGTVALLSSGDLTITVPAPTIPSDAKLFYHLITLTPTHIDVGVDARRAEYKHLGVMPTEIELSYYPRIPYSGLLWEQSIQDPIRVDSFGFRDVIISPETTEGFEITPYVVNPFGTGGSVFLALTMINGDDGTSGVAFKITQEGQKIHILWYNSLNDDVQIAASLLGVGYYSKGPQTVLVVDADLVEYNRGRHSAIKVDLTLVSDENEAQKIGESLLELLKRQVDSILSIEYAFGNSPRDVARMQRILGVTIGSTVTITEEQTGIDHMLHMLIGEQFSFSAGQLLVTHTFISLSNT